MKRFQPEQLGYVMLVDSTITAKQARRNAERRQNRVAVRALDRALREGDDIFEPVSAVEARRELSDSGVFLGVGLLFHSRIEASSMHPEEQVQHEYDGDTPQDPEYWGHKYR